MNWEPIREIKVGLDFGPKQHVLGRLAQREQTIYFEYDEEFIARGLELSPIRLPLGPGVLEFERFLFDGLPGLFDDSLPDGWGRLLVDRSLRAQSVLPNEVTPLDRLAFVGKTALGALTYEPDKGQTSRDNEPLDLDTLAAQTQKVILGKADEVLDELIGLNGSSAGARPKALIGLNADRQEIVHGKPELPVGFVPWLVKFPNTQDGQDAGAIEYVYSVMAQNAGVTMEDTHLFPASNGAGYFATKRFDRVGDNRLHTHTACGLLHSNFRAPVLDYEDLLAVTEYVTRDIREVEKMFRLAVFNVLAFNRDDHSKNFTFLMHETGEWKLSPAYDLTFSHGPGGEQSTSVMGEGRTPGTDHLKKLGEKAKLKKTKITEIIDQTRDSLSIWRNLAAEHGVSKQTTSLINDRMKGVI